jgi:chemotaxis protein MotA
MEDPTTIGPAMAVALLTMFYGTLLGELVFRSMANSCLNKQNIVLQRPSRRGFSSVYLTMVGLFMLMTTFMVMLLAMG